MCLGLKHAGTTYQRLVSKFFKPLICRNVEVYVDDILIRSPDLINHVAGPQKTFALMRKYRMKLKLLKYAFLRVTLRFLGFMVMSRKIEMNPEKMLQSLT